MDGMLHYHLLGYLRVINVNQYLNNTTQVAPFLKYDIMTLPEVYRSKAFQNVLLTKLVV